jgi:hypothetical protein
MKPGRRRLLIPGLLIALLIVVAMAAALRRADAETTPLPVVPHTQVSVMSDPRITESSGLAASEEHAGIAYTVNDSGDSARIFAVDIASGAVVGVTTVENATWHDAEAMALWGGKVWIADVGSNRGVGDARALFAFDEPGPGNHRVTADRYPIRLDGGAVEIEAMAVVPGRIYLFSKGWPHGYTFLLAGKASKGAQVARLVNGTTPAWTTDATATADGRYILIRGAVQVEVREVRTWKLVHADVIPVLRQGETITMDPSGTSYLIGSEGTNSPLVRIAFNPATFTTPPPPIDPKVQIEAQRPVQSILWRYQAPLLWAAPYILGGVVLAGVAWWMRRRRRRRVKASPDADPGDSWHPSQ